MVSWLALNTLPAFTLLKMAPIASIVDVISALSPGVPPRFLAHSRLSAETVNRVPPAAYTVTFPPWLVPHLRIRLLLCLIANVLQRFTGVFNFVMQCSGEIRTAQVGGLFLASQFAQIVTP